MAPPGLLVLVLLPWLAGLVSCNDHEVAGAIGDLSAALTNRTGSAHVSLVTPDPDADGDLLESAVDAILAESEKSVSVSILDLRDDPVEFFFEYARKVTIFLGGTYEELEKYLMKAWLHGRFNSDYFVMLDYKNKGSGGLMEDARFARLAERFYNFVVVTPTRGSQNFTVLEVFNQALRYSNSLRVFERVNVWVRDKGFYHPDAFFVTITKMDFGGHPFRVIPMENKHPMQLNYNEMPNGTRTGTEIIAFGILAKHMNFKINFVPNKDGKVYGVYNAETDTWKGLVGMLHREEADWSIPKISVSQQRYTVIDYSQVPYSHTWTAVSFLTLPPGNIKPWFQIVYPFHRWVWLSILAAFIVTCPILYFLLYWLDRYDLVTIMAWMVNIMTGRGMKTTLFPSTVTTLLALITWSIFATVIDMAYTSMLATSLMIQVKEKTVDTWQDAMDAGYTISYAYGSYVHATLKSASPETAQNIHDVYEYSMKQNPDDTFVPLKAVKVQEAFEKNPYRIYVKIERFPIPMAHAFNSSGFQILRVGKEKDYGYWASIPWRKHFPYLELFNKYSQKFWDMGLTNIWLDRMAKQGGMRLLEEDTVKSGNRNLDLDVFRVPMIMLVIGVGISIVIMIWEVTKPKGAKEEKSRAGEKGSMKSPPPAKLA